MTTILFIIGLLVLVFFCAVDLWHLKEILRVMRKMERNLYFTLEELRNKK